MLRMRNMVIGSAVGVVIVGGGVASASATSWPSHVKTWAAVNLRLDSLHNANVRQNARIKSALNRSMVA